MVPDGVVVQTVVVVTGAFTGVDAEVDFTVVCVTGVVVGLDVAAAVCDVVVVVAAAPALLCAR